MVRGMAPIDDTISRALAASPLCSDFMRRKASMSSGGYSLVERMVHSTAPRNATAPM